MSEQELLAENARLRDVLERQIEHQIQSDFRIINQVGRIKQLENDLRSDVNVASYYRKIAMDSELYKDEQSSFWKIRTLDTQVDQLERRICSAKEFLKGKIPYSTLYKLAEPIVPTMPSDADPDAVSTINELCRQRRLRQAEINGALKALDGKA